VRSQERSDPRLFIQQGEHVSELPAEFHVTLNEIHRDLRHVDGWLSDREIDFLALLAACPTSSGTILEFGALHGRSTIVLARAAELANCQQIVTVDPLADSILSRNLEQAGVRKNVDVRRAYSWEVIPEWKRPVRLFWHDGANKYDVVTDDVRGIMPHLQDSAIVAFHDVLNPSGQRLSVFIEQVLDSPSFSAVGVCGSIGWGQFCVDPSATNTQTETRQSLRRRLLRLEKYHGGDHSAPRGLTRLRYKLLRSRVPHGPVDPRQWLEQVTVCASLRS